MIRILETERLNLREFTINDTAFIVELLNTKGWLEFIGDRNVKNEEQAKSYLENGPMKSYKVNGYGLWMVELKNKNVPIGMCGIINRGTLDHPDIGFALLPEFAGKGYAFEIANATIKHAGEKLNLTTINAITVPNNKTSIKLLEKIGLRFIKRFHLPDDEEELMLFSN